jgi:hypothetical protein
LSDGVGTSALMAHTGAAGLRRNKRLRAQTRS